MSRARDARNAEFERQVAARRNSAAHRGLRRRMATRQVPDAVVPSSGPATVELAVAAAPLAKVAPEVIAPPEPEVIAPPEPESQADDTEVLAPVDVETVAVAAAAIDASQESPPAISPYEAHEVQATDPTPTQTFASLMGAAPTKRRRWLPWLIALLIVIGVYLAVAFFTRNDIPEGTTIEGVPAGRSVEEARATTQAIAAAAHAKEVTLTAGENSTGLDPASAGLAVDVEATVGSAGGFTLNPAELWHRLTGEGTDHAVVVTVAEPAFTDATNAATGELNSTAADASVTIEGTEAVVTPGTQTVAVEPETLREELLAVWPTLAEVEVTADVEDAAITNTEARALAAALNGHVFAGPTTLTGDNGDSVLPAGQIAANSTIESADGSLTWVVDSAAISELMRALNPDLENKPVDANYRFTKAHKLKITEGEPGRELDVDAVGPAVVAAAGTVARTGPIPYIETEPEITADELPTQDFTKKVSTFSTPITPEPIRTRNLVRAAELITGTVVKPGERFNLTDTIGPITAANGYYDAHVIVNGLLVTGIGGGLSQVATTVYNASYFAGYDDIEHRPHSVWFPRYPAGRESTVLNGSINVVFENTTPYAMIMNSYVENGKMTVDIWSTPYYRVETKASEKTNFTQPGTVVSSADNCEAKGKGQPGFKITNTRWVYLGDELIEKRSWTWTYRADPAIECVRD